MVERHLAKVDTAVQFRSLAPVRSFRKEAFFCLSKEKAGDSANLRLIDLFFKLMHAGDGISVHGRLKPFEIADAAAEINV